ncbi:hypothetical protein LTS01_025303 [Friedmanniomyces endolithicus]|nr:hypothetical protein LTS01_025303 [Friedmanniomyces endolithicus]
MKERERKKRCRQKNTNCKQWSDTKNKQVLSEPALLGTVLATDRTDSEPNDGIFASDSGDPQVALLVTYDDCGTQSAGDLQHKLAALSAASISPLEVRPKGGAQCRPVSASCATYPKAPDPACSEVIAGMELDFKALQEGNSTSADELHVIPLDEEADSSVQQPEYEILHERNLKVATPSYSMPVCTNASECTAESSEQLNLDDNTAMPSAASLESNSGHTLEAVTTCQANTPPTTQPLSTSYRMYVVTATSARAPAEQDLGWPAGHISDAHRRRNASGRASTTNFTFTFVTWHSWSGETWSRTFQQCRQTL